MNFGASSGTTTVRNDLAINGGDITTSSLSASVFNSNAITVNAFGAATNLSIASESGLTSINNDLVVRGGDISTPTETASIFNENATAVNAFGAAVTLSLGSNSGTTSVNNNLSIGGYSNVASGRTYKIGNTDVLSYNTLGTNVIYSSLTTLGTITDGTWNADTVDAIYGGTGISLYSVGDMVYADTTTTLAKLTKGSSGQMLHVDESDNYAWTSRIDGGVYA